MIGTLNPEVCGEAPAVEEELPTLWEVVIAGLVVVWPAILSDDILISDGDESFTDVIFPVYGTGISDDIVLLVEIPLIDLIITVDASNSKVPIRTAAITLFVVVKPDTSPHVSIVDLY